MPPSDWPEQGQNEQEGTADAAAAVPAGVAASIQAFVASLTTPETELEQQVLEAAHRWCARHDPPAVKKPIGQNGFNPCLAGSSISNTRSSGTNWSSGAAADPLPPGGDASANDASSSGRSSEEGSSAAWRLAAWLQRQGWPAQHCASFRSGSSGVGGSGTGWRFTSGHEFVLLYPHHCGGAPDPGGGAAAAAGSDSSSTTSSASGNTEAQLDGMAADMACDAPAIVVDPEFATQFALTSPTPRYQLVMQLLPRVFVGTHDRLQRLVEWACREMRACFQDSGSGLPPWRSLGHVLSKWRLQGGSRSGSPPAQEERQPAVQAASPPAVQQEQRGAPTGPASAPAACGVAFSAEQQQAMRSLLLHPPAAKQTQQGGRCAVPAPPCAPLLSAHSSVSSMDMAPMLAGPGAAPQPASPAAPVHSLLTAELQQMAEASAREAQEWGPAAAILSLAYGCGQTSPWR